MHRDRAIWAALGVLGLVCAAMFLRERGPAGLSWFMRCIFHDLTGLSCPGCGMTRAAYAALHGRIAEAFRLNPVGMVLLPAACIGLGIQILGWIRGKPFGFRFQLGGRYAWAILWVVVLFGILRNIPHWPFTQLAPP